jgi:hypothetical protein
MVAGKSSKYTGRAVALPVYRLPITDAVIMLSFLSVFLLCVLTATAEASLQADLFLAVEHQQNVRADSTRVEDTHSTFGASLDYNITPQMVVSWQGVWRQYAENSDLDYSNHEIFLGYQAGKRRQRFNLYTGLFAVRRDYQEEIWRLDSSVTGAEAMLRYYRRPGQSLRLELELSSVHFPVYTEADHVRLAAGIGTNISLPTRGGLDLGLRLEQLDYSGQSSSVTGNANAQAIKVNQIGLEGRISQSLGARAGVNLAVWRDEIFEDDEFLFDTTQSSYLAPGVLLFDEEAVRIQFKYILPEGLISRLSWRAARREFLQSQEIDQVAPNRVDDEQLVSLELRKNIRFGKITKFEPVLTLSRIVTTSTDTFYDYDDWQLNFTLKLHL